MLEMIFRGLLPLYILVICNTFNYLSDQEAQAQTTIQDGVHKKKPNVIRQTISRVNNRTLTISTGDINSTSAAVAQDLALLLNDGSKKRVLPVLGLDAVLTISDVLHLYGVDAGIVHEDTLQLVAKNNVFPNIGNRLRYITRLFPDNIYIIANRRIGRIEELEGRVVNFGPGLKSPYTTASILMRTLGVHVRQVNLHHEIAVKKIARGEIYATVIVGGRAERVGRLLKSNPNLKLLNIPWPSNSDYYIPKRLTHKAYPNLVRQGQIVDTVSVGLVFIVNGWGEGHPRHKKVKRFTDQLFARFSELHDESYLNQWRQVNLFGSINSWDRFAAARTWLARNRKAPAKRAGDGLPLAKMRAHFNSFVDEQMKNTGRSITRQQKIRMFEEYLRWQLNTTKVIVDVRATAANGVGRTIGKLVVRNGEMRVAGKREPALLIRPVLKGLKPGEYAFHIHEKPACGPAMRDGVPVPGLAAGDRLKLEGLGEYAGVTFDADLGDLPDIYVDPNGKADKEIIAFRKTVGDLINRSLVIYATKSEKSERIACGFVR